MPKIEATLLLDQVGGVGKFSLDLQGASEMEHEVLAALIGSGRSVSIAPAHKADELFAEFTITDPTIFATAQRSMENRKRKANGQPTVEEEEARAKAIVDAQTTAKVDELAREAKAQEELKEQRDESDRRIAEIASKTALEFLKAASGTKS